MVNEQASEGSRLRQVTTAVAPQVQHDAGHILGFELIQQTLNIPCRAAIVLITCILRGNILVEARNRDDADLEGLAIAGDVLDLLVSGLGFESDLVAHKLEDLLR